MKYCLYIIKRHIEDLFIFPFVAFGRLISKKCIAHKQFDIVFIFPFYHTGGAEKVHLEIARAFKHQKCLILFTRKSIDDCFKQSFEEIGHEIVDISTYTDNKRTYWNNLIWRGVVAAFISSQNNKTIIFNGQSNFGYKLSRWIDSQYPQVELIHSFNSFSWIRIPFIQFYSKTVMISHKAIEQHHMQYKKHQIPSIFFNKITYINNGIEIDNTFMPNKSFNKDLNVLYVGRATPEKRPLLFCNIAQTIQEHQLPIHFQMAGDISPYLKDECKKGIKFHGAVHDATRMNTIYDQADILMVTSSEEGFPLVIMEAMARGCIIVSTPVGDIPFHIKDGENGYLFSESINEQQILKESLLLLQNMNNDRSLLQRISDNNIKYAKRVFELSTFAESYNRMFESIKA